MPALQFFSKPCDAIDEADLVDLIEAKKVRERLQLDDKLTVYKHDRPDTLTLVS